MTSPFTGPAASASASPDVLVHWLADLLSSEARLTEWQQLADGQRAAWLHDEGYDATELNGSLAAFSAAVDVEPALADAVNGGHFQFLRKGYFCTDTDSKPGHLVFNRTVTLKDTWAKEQKKS